MFDGLRLDHASDVPLMLNLASGAIAAQFHEVFDDLLTNVSSIGREDDQPPEH